MPYFIIRIFVNALALARSLTIFPWIDIQPIGNEPLAATYVALGLLRGPGLTENTAFAAIVWLSQVLLGTIVQYAQLQRVPQVSSQGGKIVTRKSVH